jgi:hypothetical protein
MSSTTVDSPKEGSSRVRSSKTPLNPKDSKTCKTIIKSLIKHKVGWPFAEPVDPVKLDIPDYFDIITHPMDFGTISKRLDKNFYSTPEQVQSDVNLVFNNAIRYNPPGSDICVMVETLKKFFDSKWSAAKFGAAAPSSPASNTTPAVPVEKSKSAKPTPTSTPTKSAQASQSAQLQKKRKSEAEDAGSRTENKHKSASTNAATMTFEEKKVLGEKINVLPQKELGKVVEIIRRAISSIDDQLAVEENIEIDMEELDNATLRRLERFVNQSLAKAGEQEGKETSSAPPEGSESSDVKANPNKKRKEQ